MSAFSVFQRSVLLHASPGDVYAFHEDPRNITKISPPSLRVELVECSVPARAGEAFRLKVVQFGLPIEWIGFWEDAVPQERLVDVARKSPFRHWRHHHIFQSEGEGVVMIDRVEYAVDPGHLGPFGFLARLADATVMKVVFTAMFLARHRATRKFFAQGAAGG